MKEVEFQEKLEDEQDEEEDVLISSANEDSDEAHSLNSPSFWGNLPGEFYLVTCILIISSEASVFVILNRIDAMVYMPCNILCASSTYGLLLMILYFVAYKKCVTIQSVNAVSSFTWKMLAIGSILFSVIGPYFYLLGLQSTATTVPGASIIKRMESLNFTVLSWLFLQMKITPWIVGSSTFTFLGIVLALVWESLYGNSSFFSNGYCYILLSGFAFSASLIITKKYLSSLNVGVIAIGRTLVGTILFHMLSWATGSNDHLYNVVFWLYMLPYGLVYIYSAQVLWLTTLSVVSPSTIGIGTTSLFPMSLVWSAVLLQQYPTSSEWIGSVFIIVGIIFSLVEVITTTIATERGYRQVNMIGITAK